ncbi:MAG: putative hydrolase of the HAD superfamily [Verrucomicrobiales bacterium]
MIGSLTKALIFDFDGLVVDTETPLYDSWRELYQAHDHDLTLETYVECVGSTTQRFDPLTYLQELIGPSRVLDLDALHQEHRSRVTHTLSQRDTLPGVRERIAEAQGAGIQLAIASSSPSEWIDPWLAKLGIRDHFAVVRTLDHVNEAKPSPELFLTAAEKLGVEPHQAIVFEDSFNGLQGALAAKIPCVAIPNRVTGNSDFSRATLVLQSMADHSLTEILDQVNATP